MTEFDLVIRNGKIATAADVFSGDIGIQSGRIEAIAASLGRGREEIDAAGRTITPGGIDGHIHLEQRLPDGAEIADNFYTGSRSAACGGTTTIIPFAFQDHGASLSQVLADYRESAEGRCFIDYAFHAIITDPTAQVLNQELPSLVREGYTSYKLYMTYEGLQLTDRQVLDVLTAMRREQAISMVHAENTEFIEWLTERLVNKGLTAPKYHTKAHPVIGEREATHRAMSMSELVGVPIVLVHVSAREVVEQIDWARAKGLAIHAETCPQYLLLTEDAYEVEGFEGGEVYLHPAAPQRRRPGGDLGCARARRLRHRLLRSFALPLRRPQGQTDRRNERGLSQGAERRPRRGDPDAAALLRGRSQGPDRR